MFTRRDVLVALSAVVLTAGAFALADHGSVLGSTAIDWNSLPAKPTATGSVRTVLRAPTATLKELEIHVTTLNPGQEPHPPHRHAHEELLIIKEGTVEALINGEWKRVGPGSVIFFASNQWHGLRNVGSVPAVYHVIAFKTDESAAAEPSTVPAPTK